MVFSDFYLDYSDSFFRLIKLYISQKNKAIVFLLNSKKGK